jgi:hypothetical protein
VGVDIRRADLESDRDMLIESLRRYLTSASDGRRFDWLYTANPHGRASVWIATDTESGEFIGMVTGFPRRMCLAGRITSAWVLGDFCVGDKYRSLGPALQLQRTCLADVNSGTVPFCYDMPNTAMLAVYRRMGIAPSRQMFRMAKMLRVNRKVAESIGSSLVAEGVSLVGNALLGLGGLRRRLSGRKRAVEIVTDEKECGDEFSRLAEEIGSRYGVCVFRSADYLNWRYFANTYQQYQMITARRNGRLLGYAFFTQSGDQTTLSDLYGAEDPDVIGSLVETVVTISRERAVSTVSVPIGESHPWRSLLRSMGFVARESTPVITYGASDGFMKGGLDETGVWFLMHGDRDS